MPPKPFNPPRPTGEVAKKALGRPRGSTNTKAGAGNGKIKKPGAKASKAKRLSDAALARLGELSSDENEVEGEEEGGEDLRSRGKGKVPTKTSAKSRGSNTALSQSQDSLEAIDNDDDDDNDSDPFASQQPSTATTTHSKPPNTTTPQTTTTQAIPPALLTVLLNSFFRHPTTPHTRIKPSASRAVGRYVDTFVREAVARAAWEGVERRGGGGAGGGTQGGGVLEVEDLERLAPQLLLDF